MATLAGKTLFITGASRGIGREIALRAARDGANVVVAAKTATPHPRLAGTIHTVAAEIEAAGGQALAIALDVRDEAAIATAVAQAVDRFGGLDILVNNASAISLTKTAETPARRFDLMMAVNVRATFLCSQACLPHLLRAANPHVLNLAPPISLEAKWLAGHVAYTISKYGMSLCTLGMAAEWREAGIAVNGLWPRTTIATAAVEFNFPEEILRRSRRPAIMADAAHAILAAPARERTGRLLLDEDVLREAGVTDFGHYALAPGEAPYPDLFVD